MLIPTRHPLSFAHAATLFILVSKSFFIPNVPFLVLLPVASAVPAAAESVTPLVAENVVATVAKGNCVKSSGVIPISPFSSERYISVPNTWLTPIPSPMK